MKKGIIFLITIIVIFSLIILGISNIKPKEANNEKIKIVATLFPQYDFAKQIGGDKVDVTLLLTPGTETHTYEPTPQDIINVNKSDLFIYTGAYMEPWSDKIASGIDSNTIILDCSKNINLISLEQHSEEHDNHEKHDDEQNDNHEKIESESHNHEYDPHIWLNPENAIGMVNNITDELCNIDPQNSAYYKANAKNYIEQINLLDADIQNTIKQSEKNKIAFGGTFAYMYFVKKYNLEYVSAYQSCGEDTEPSAANVKKVIDYMKQNDIPVIFYQEQSSGKIADTIASETGAIKLVLHTVHNASQEEIDRGETYISLMRKNLENLKIALS
ncbi:MAG: zinc ABC transporter substrate-binding protein [Clostridia bacterium]|nr:zinc ABC transporter substrate-binding protein [Clostridia bacterium]